MNTDFLLLKDIQAALEKAFSKIPMRESGGNESYRPPALHIGQLPNKQVDHHKRDNSDQYYPFVLVRPIDGESGQAEETCNVAIICGAYSAESIPEHGFQDISNLITRTRMVLMVGRLWGRLPSGNYAWERKLPITYNYGLVSPLNPYEAGLMDKHHYGGLVKVSFAHQALAQRPFIQTGIAGNLV